MKKLLLICCLTPLFSYAQQFRLFADSIKKLRPAFPEQSNIIHQGIYSYIPNSSTDGTINRSISTLIKVDTSGRTIWTAVPANFVTRETEAANLKFQSITLGSDSNIYALLSNTKLAKIRSTNGSMDWMSTLTPANTLSRKEVLDYDGETLLFGNSITSANKVRMIRYRKSNGENLGYKDLQVPAPGIFRMHTAAGAIYIANADSLYKFNSFDNPVLEWKVKLCSGTDRFLDVFKISQEGNNLLVFGNKESGFHNGMVSCVDILTGTVKWFVKNGNFFDLMYADHKVKNGFLYTVWKHLYVGSVDEKCFINRIEMSTGLKSWEFNHAFRTQSVFVEQIEGMTSIDIDDNDMLYLTGYGLPDNQTTRSWAFIKVRGKDGAVIKRNYLPGSIVRSDLYSTGVSNRLVDGKLYATGQLPDQIAGAHLDTSTLSSLKTTPYESSLQYPSSIIGIRNFSTNKKVIFYQQGKSLKVQLADAQFKKIWEKTIGDTLYPYVGFDVIGVNDSLKTIHVIAKRYRYAPTGNFYFPPSVTDSLLLSTYDSLGNVTYRYKRNEEPTIQNPYQFFQDSLGVTWYARIEGSMLYAGSIPSPIFSISGRWTAKPYTLLKPVTYFAYSKDTILMFKDPDGFSRASVRKTWSGYLPVNGKQWYFPGVRWFNNVAREDKENYYAMARDSSSNDMLFKFRLKDSAMVWTKKFDSTVVTLKGDAYNGSFYCMSTTSTGLMLRKFNGSTGDLIWSKTINPMPGHVLKPADFAISKQHSKMTIAAYQVDTMIREMSKLHIVSFDTSGSQIQSIMMDGYKSWQNKATSIVIGQDGQTLVSGQISDATAGYAGFILALDSSTLTNAIAAPQISSIVSPVCSSSTLQKAKLFNPATSPAVISILLDNNIVLAFNRSDSSFQYPIASPGTHTIKITYSNAGTEASTQVSFRVNATPPTGAAPTQISNSLVAPATGTSYQWYFNGQVIAGASTNTLPAQQNGVYHYTYSIDGCTSLASASINYIVSGIIDPTNNNAEVSISPNPTKGFLLLSNLAVNSRYGIQILNMNGAVVIPMTLLTAGNTARFNLENLTHGSYILQLWNITKHREVGKQLIILLK